MIGKFELIAKVDNIIQYLYILLLFKLLMKVSVPICECTVMTQFSGHGRKWKSVC
jgi:hypothetical protein